MEKINIGKLLKDCPKGMELDCTICDNVYLDEVTPHMIKCFSKDNVYNTIYFHHDGTYLTNKNAKCVIFPKGKTTWEGFHRPFKDGDVLYIDCNDGEDTYEQHQYIFILKQISEGKIDSYCYVNGTNESKFEICWLATMDDIKHGPRFATEEEKQELFKVIKDNGYKWNPETKTLEKLPKFNDGDIIFEDIFHSICIFKKEGSIKGTVDYYCGISFDYFFVKDEKDIDEHFGNISDYRLATKEEKQRLFDAIKANGHKWNDESKTLEKLVVPKFKVGDKIVKKNSICVPILITQISNEFYFSNTQNSIVVLPISEQNDWELVPIIPIFNVEDKIRRKGDSVLFTIKAVDYNHYIMEPINSSDGLNNCNVLEYISFSDQNNYELVPDKFDISTLKPFESRVLVRTDNRKWVSGFYSHYDKDSLLLYCVVGGLWYEQCIPFEGNEHLLNTTDECDDYYKNW